MCDSLAVPLAGMRYIRGFKASERNSVIIRLPAPWSFFTTLLGSFDDPDYFVRGLQVRNRSQKLMQRDDKATDIFSVFWIINSQEIPCTVQSKQYFDSTIQGCVKTVNFAGLAYFGGHVLSSRLFALGRN
jgi:penicillin V acylase-like amidase (Ntn superfamily)